MGEATIDPKALEEAMLKALPTLFPNLLGATRNARIEFFDKFQREADEYDSDFTTKYGGDLDTTLIFAGLFSAVASAFIIDVESQLQPDYTQFSYTVLTIIANVSLGHTPTGSEAAFPQWAGPDPAIIHIQAILYSSLAASLLSAFIAMLGKQWLNRYSQVELRGSIIDRGRYRQRKMNGIVTWHFDLVMETLPLMLQGALLLLGYALSSYLFTISNVIAGVVLGFTVFGLLFYLLIVSAATLSYNCPFQTPLPLIIRFMVRFDGEHRRYLKRSRRWFGRIFSFFRKERPQRPGPNEPHPSGSFGVSDGPKVDDRIELPMVAIADQQPPLFPEEPDWNGYVLDSDCITWMFETSMDADVIMAIMKFIPEVVWHAGIQAVPLERLYGILFECFDHSSGCPVVIPRFRDRAYFSARAFLHLAIQRKCIGHESDRPVLESISNRRLVVRTKHYDGDSDLESTLGTIDRVLDNYEKMHWHTFSFSTPHHAWMSHILLHRAWDSARNNSPLPDDIEEFVLLSLRPHPPPPASIITDCLLIIGLVLGIKLHLGDLFVTDKSQELKQQINRIYEKLVQAFQNPSATSDDIALALKAMELIAPLSQDEISVKSHHLFRVVVETPDYPSYSQEKRWQASRLALRGAYERGSPLQWVDIPEDIFAPLGRRLDQGGTHWVTSSVPNHARMSHILLYCAWDTLGSGMPLPDDIKDFILHSLGLDPPPPAQIIADCLFIVGLTLGIKLQIDDLSVIDKGDKLNEQTGKIYDKLGETFQNPFTPDEIDCALEAMGLIAPLCQNEIATKSYQLFHVVMQAPVSVAFSQERKWEASRLAMHGAYKWDKYLPWVDDPQDILTFLLYHFELATRSNQSQDEPIHDALRALAYASNDVTALELFDPTEPSFVSGIFHIYQDYQPFELRKAALFFLPLVSDKLFNTRCPIMEPKRMRSLCVDWASAVYSVEHTDDVQKAILEVLFDMINSPRWRPHVVTDAWSWLEYYTSVRDDSPHLKRCIDNPELTDAIISSADNLTGTTLWLGILWLKYKELTPEVQKKLETATEEAAQGGRKADLDTYLSLIDSEVMKVEGELTQHATWSTDPTAVALKTRIDHLQQARASLVAFKGD